MSGLATVAIPTEATGSTANPHAAQVVAARAVPPPSGDPLRWTCKEVLAWLDYVFQVERLRLSDLTFYLRWHVAQYGEKLTGEDLSRLNFANYLDRWGYSGPVLFERFLLLLQQNGYAGDKDLLGVWHKVQTVTQGDLNALLQSGFMTTKSVIAVEKDNGGSNKEEGLTEVKSVSREETADSDTPPPVIMMKPTPQLEVVQPAEEESGMYAEFEQTGLHEVLSPTQLSVSRFYGPSGASEGSSEDSDYDSFQSSDKADSPGSSSSSGSDMLAVKRRKPRECIPKLPTFPGNTVLTLWEFLLELLADPTYSTIIKWENRKVGIFVIKDSEVTAALWGLHRRKDGMNYDKMSRALRYYYKKKLLKKVPGNRLTYKFLRDTHWMHYKPQRDGYDTTHVGDQQLASLGRLSRRGQKQDQLSQGAYQAEMHAMADVFTWSDTSIPITT